MKTKDPKLTESNAAFVVQRLSR